MADLSPSLTANPNPEVWISPAAEHTIHVRTGKVELGQGALTALAQIVADGLRVRIERVRMIPASTDGSPNEGYTAGSLSIQHSGAALRAVAAAWHACLLDTASAAFGVTDSLVVEDGVVTHDGRTFTYWDLPADAQPEVGATSPVEYAVVGTSVGRLDIPGRVFGTRRYLQDMRLPDQLFGRVLRPPSRGARLLNVDDTRVRALPGVVTVVHDGDFVGLVADREDVAVRALELLAADCAWKREPSLPDQHDLAGYLRAAPAERAVLVDQGPESDAPPSVEVSFSRPYLAHASIGTACAIAEWHGGRLRVWSHSQGIYQLRAELARWFDIQPDQVVVTHVEGAGCYGHNGADDAAGDAALLAAAVPGRPVHVVWSRQDELGWAPFGPAMAVTVRVTVDDAGRPSHWTHEIWSNGHSGRPASAGSPPLLAAILQAGDTDPVPSTEPPLNRGGGSARNAVPGYRVPNVQVVTNRLATMPLRTSALRSLGAHLNVYAVEAVMDQLAVNADTDPVAYRLALLDDPRGRAVIEAVAEAANWGVGGQVPDTGRGIGYARYKNLGAYCAVVADVEVTSRVTVTRLTIAVDVGLTVNPDGVRNQIEGGAIQALSWTTTEQVRFDAHDVTSRTWEDYPIATFPDVPPIETVIVDRPDLPSLGAGETSLGPTAAAIGNAVRDALGATIHDLPLTAENLMRSL
ncbi:MAG TPA: molybdopterin cofactor-binding domain-containing protein [Pseudonocardiaceae bacterium]|nr:molybdopterin cofactor-binding domain-containing protein [Pseudonocardiaceae bacterium]